MKRNYTTYVVIICCLRCARKVPEIYFPGDGDGTLLFYKQNIRFVLVGAEKIFTPKKKNKLAPESFS